MTTAVARKLPVIGSRFTGKPFVRLDTDTGMLQQSLPPLSADDERLQRALLAEPRRVLYHASIETLLLVDHHINQLQKELS